MKKVLVAVALLFALGSVSTVSAQDAPKPKKQQFAWSKAIMDEIGLSADVQANVEAYKKENDLENKVVKEDASLTPEDKKKQLQALAVKRQKGIYALMTPEQVTKAKEIQERIKLANAASAQ